MEELKQHKGIKYSGMSVGSSHDWNYEDCRVQETKVSPDEWQFRMTSIKRKRTPTRSMGNIMPGTKYDWAFFGRQKVMKLDENSYETELVATKRKVGHKREYWKKFSYEYEDQIRVGKSEKQLMIGFLNDELKKILKSSPIGEKQMEIGECVIK